MPDAAGNIKGVSLSGEAGERLERILSGELKEPAHMKAIRELRDFNPLGGAHRGVGRCTCYCGPGTDPACPVHP